MFNGLGPPTCGNREIVGCIVAYLMQHKTPSTCHLSPSCLGDPPCHVLFGISQIANPKYQWFTVLKTPKSRTPISRRTWVRTGGVTSRYRDSRNREIPLSLIPCTENSQVPNPEILRSCTTCPVVRSTAPIESGNRYSRFQMVRNAYLHKHRSPISR
jgi:hypothetical protein